MTYALCVSTVTGVEVGIWWAAPAQVARLSLLQSEFPIRNFRMLHPSLLEMAISNMHKGHACMVTSLLTLGPGFETIRVGRGKGPSAQLSDLCKPGSPLFYEAL